MILGLNTDVRYKGKTFHIQTEDSGPENPVLITHVFLGGTILGTERTTYESDDPDSDEFEARVRELMRTQHRKMYKALLDGAYEDAARRPPRSKSASGPIPLAKKRKGIISRPSRRSSPPKRASKPPQGPPSNPPQRPVSNPPQRQTKPAKRPSVNPPTRNTPSAPAAARASGPPPIPSTQPIVAVNSRSEPPARSAPADGEHQPAEPRLAFPTALTSASPLSDLLLSYLLEEPDET